MNGKVKAKCDRHPNYDPSTKGKDFINDRCGTCKEIADLYDSKTVLEKALKNFERRVVPWQTIRKSIRENPEIK